MCGILGASRSIDDVKFKMALDSLSHRGPDDFGIWSDPGYIILGHRRLSILDLTKSGHQPMVGSSGRYVLVFNGEIFNFVEIKNDLKKRGHIFKGDSDTEVILAAYLEWGAECQQRFNGMWAFAVWDTLEKSLFISRDRFGIKPLYYAFTQDYGFTFSSEQKSLCYFLRDVNPSKNINEHLLFLFDYEHTEDCVIDGIKRLPPGYCGLYKDGRFNVRRWWNTLDNLLEPPIRYKDQVDAWREIFLDSVRIQMRADVPIGCALSGGLDSSATFSSMAHIALKSDQSYLGAKNWQHGFCSHYPNSSLDEFGWAKLVGESLGLPIESVEINPTQCKWSIKEALYQVEDPYLTLPIPMLMTYGAIAKAGIKVSIDGHGADELFSGYKKIQNYVPLDDLIRYVEVMAIDRSTKTGKYAPSYSNLGKIWMRELCIRAIKDNSEKARKVVKALLGRADWDFINYKLSFDDQLHPVYGNFDNFTKQLYELYHVSVLPTLLRNYDRYSMASGVEIRMPFTDWRLVAFTFSLPWTSKVGAGFTKRIMRDALKGIMPEKIRMRRDKIGWNAPLHEWFRGPLKNEIDDFISKFRLPLKIKKRWISLQNNSNANFDEGQKVWSDLMPYFWQMSLFGKIQNGK